MGAASGGATTEGTRGVNRTGQWIAILVAAVLTATAARAEYEVVDEIVAVVENEIITVSDVVEQTQLLMIEMQVPPDRATPALADSLQTEVLTQLIDQILVVKEAERRGIEVPATELEAYLDQQIEDQVERFGGTDAFLSQLEREGLTLKQMRAVYREDIRRQLLSRRLVGAELDTEIEIDDAQVVAYFEANRDALPAKPASVRLRHLVVRPKPEAETEAAILETLRAARRRLDAGEEFAAVAADVSQDPTASRGGDLGWIAPGDLADDLFSSAAFALPDSAISDIVRSRYGYHIIQRLGTRGTSAHFRHIVIPNVLTDADRARARALVETARRRLEEGVDFVEVVRAYSDDPTGDGDVGYFPLDQLYPAFREAIEPLMIGAYSEVVEDDVGFHVFQLLDRKAAQPYTLDEVAPDIRDALRREAIATRYNEWVDQLRERSYVDIRKPGIGERG